MVLIIRDNGIIDFFSRDRLPVLTLKIDPYLDVKAFKRSLKLTDSCRRNCVKDLSLLYLFYYYFSG